METVELKRCPFCNGEAKFEKYANVFWKVKCTRCPCDMGRMWFKDKREAKKAWNRRDEKITVHIDNKEVLKILNKKMIEERGIHNERN